MESPMMARRSPGCSSRPAGAGAFTGANLVKYASSGFGSNSAANKFTGLNATKIAASRMRRGSFENGNFMVGKFEPKLKWASRCES